MLDRYNACAKRDVGVPDRGVLGQLGAHADRVVVVFGAEAFDGKAADTLIENGSERGMKRFVSRIGCKKRRAKAEAGNRKHTRESTDGPPPGNHRSRQQHRQQRQRDAQ